MKTRNLKLSAAAASFAMLFGGLAFAQAPMPPQEPAPAPPPVRAEPAPQGQPPGQGSVDMTGYLNTEATKEVCKERYPKAADKIEGTWKRVSADAPPAMKAQASAPDYKAALSAKVKELKAGDPAALKASCENMSK